MSSHSKEAAAALDIGVNQQSFCLSSGTEAFFSICWKGRFKWWVIYCRAHGECGFV